MPTKNFKSLAAYKRYAAYGNIHGLFQKVPGNQKITIRGKPHKVVHKK